MTAEGYQALDVELKRLKTVERPSVIAAIAEARTHGDLSENAEYHAAKERQSFIEGRVAELEDKIVEALRALDAHAEQMHFEMGGVVARNLQLMARMGTYFEEQVARRYPEFPIRGGLLSWEDYLPPLSPLLRGLVEKHESAVV